MQQQDIDWEVVDILFAKLLGLNRLAALKDENSFRQRSPVIVIVLRDIL